VLCDGEKPCELSIVGPTLSLFGFIAGGHGLLGFGAGTARGGLVLSEQYTAVPSDFVVSPRYAFGVVQAFGCYSSRQPWYALASARADFIEGYGLSLSVELPNSKPPRK
jgi:hypothetical protein